MARLLGARTTLVLAGTVGAAVTLAFLFLPGMRRDSGEDRGRRVPVATGLLATAVASGPDSADIEP
jgi:hypothetical protein